MEKHTMEQEPCEEIHRIHKTATGHRSAGAMKEENVDSDEIEYPYYPTRYRFQKPTIIKVGAMVPIDTHEEFLDAEKILERRKIKGDMMMEGIKYYIQRLEEEGLMETSMLGTEEPSNNHTDTKPPSNLPPLASPKPSLLAPASTPPLTQSPGDAKETGSIKVFDKDGSSLCLFCFMDGFTIKKRDGETKYVPAGGHNGLSDKDLAFSVKFKKPIAMCYHHQQLYYKDESAKVKMNGQIAQMDKEIEETPGADYKIVEKEVDMKVLQ